MSLKRVSIGNVYLSSHSNSGKSKPSPEFGYCGAWICVSTKPGVINSLEQKFTKIHKHNIENNKWVRKIENYIPPSQNVNASTGK